MLTPKSLQYASIHNILMHNRSEIMPVKVLSLTYGGLRFTIQAVEKAMPWSIVEGFLRMMMDLTRLGPTILYNVALYWVKGSIIWSAAIIGLILIANMEGDVAQNMII